MSKVICKREDIVAIADAVRTKSNTSNAMTLEEMEDVIKGIETAIPTQEKTIDITENGKVEVTPDNGYALSKVTAKVSVSKEGIDKINRYIELNGNSAAYLFYAFGGESIDNLLDGVNTSSVTTMQRMFSNNSALSTVHLFDTSNVTDMSYMFDACPSLTKVPLFDTKNVKDMQYMFNNCTNIQSVPLFDTRNVTVMMGMLKGCSALEEVPLFNTSNVTVMTSMFSGCSSLKTVPLFDTKNVTDFNNAFFYCSALETVPELDLRNATSLSSAFGQCSKLTECWIRNIKVSLQISNGWSYGHLLTFDSLLHLCQECRKTESSLTLTLGSANLEKLANVYVQLLDITDEMRAEDDLIDEKYPFVQCGFLDEGAMTLQDYMALKNWTLA